MVTDDTSHFELGLLPIFLFYSAYNQSLILICCDIKPFLTIYEGAKMPYMHNSHTTATHKSWKKWRKKLK